MLAINRSAGATRSRRSPTTRRQHSRRRTGRQVRAQPNPHLILTSSSLVLTESASDSHLILTQSSPHRRTRRDLGVPHLHRHAHFLASFSQFSSFSSRCLRRFLRDFNLKEVFQRWFRSPVDVCAGGKLVLALPVPFPSGSTVRLHTFDDGPFWEGF